MTQVYQPARFVHAPDSLIGISKRHSGFTIAYHRNEKNVFFAYALCSKHDQYSKKEGRDRTTETLNLHIDSINDASPNVDPEKRVGVIDVSVLSAYFHDALSETLADHVIDSLNTMDFKHAFISEALSSFLYATVLRNLD